MTSELTTGKPKMTINRLHAATRWVLENWCRDNHRRLAQLRLTREEAALMAMQELAPQLERVRARIKISKPILIKPRNIETAYEIMGLVWHRGRRMTPRLTNPRGAQPH
jgi:hypothetical protein